MQKLPAQKAYQWITSLYFFQSMPFIVVSFVSTLMYQQYGFDNAKTVLITSLLALPWVIKPLFSPFCEDVSTKKQLTIFAQLGVSFIFFLLALNVNQPYFLSISFVSFACLAIISSLHDIVSDGLYLVSLDVQQQKRYVGLRTFFYQMGRLFVSGGLLAAATQFANYFEISVWRVFFFSLFTDNCPNFNLTSAISPSLRVLQFLPFAQA